VGDLMPVDPETTLELLAADIASKALLAGGVHYGRAPSTDPAVFPFVVVTLGSAVPESDTWLADDGQATLTIQTKTVGLTRKQTQMADNKLSQVMQFDRPEPAVVDGERTAVIGVQPSNITTQGVAVNEGGLWSLERFWTVTATRTPAV